MQLQDQYDWVVLGDHPGALLSAGIASQLGLSVLVLPLAPSTLVTVSPQGQVLDPEPNYVLGLGRHGSAPGLLAECLIQLGAASFTPKLIRSGTEIAPQAVSPGVRFSLALEEDVLFRELEREFGNEFAKTSGLLNAINTVEARALSHWRSYPLVLLNRASSGKGMKIPRPSVLRSDFSIKSLHHSLRISRDQGVKGVKGPGRLWIRSKGHLEDLRSRFSRLAKDESQAQSIWKDFTEAAQGIWYGVSGVDVPNPPVADWLHLVALGRTAGSFRGGMSAFRRFLLGLAQRLGAQVPTGLECRRIFIEDGKLRGIQLNDRGKMLITRAGVLGCSLSQAKESMSFTGRAGSSVLKAGAKTIGWRFTLALSVDREAVPEGMSERAIWNQPDAPPLEIEVADPTVYEQGGGDIKYIFLRTWLPFEQKSLDVSYQRLIAARMFRQLIELFPFLEFHVRRVYPDFRVSESTLGRDEFSEVYGFVSTDFIPDNLRLYREQSTGSVSGIKGLYVANGESFPTMGSFGPTVAAIEAMTHFTSSLGPSTVEKLRGFWSFLS